MATAPIVELEASAGVAWLRLNRLEALNALNRALTGALEETLERVAAMAEVSVLVVAGRGRAFCAGNDIKEMETVAADDAEALAHRHAALMDRFAALPQVTIAAVDGYALGGGLMLAIAQDLRVASDRARFGLPEVTLGFNPGYGIARLLDVVGQPRPRSAPHRTYAPRDRGAADGSRQPRRRPADPRGRGRRARGGHRAVTPRRTDGDQADRRGDPGGARGREAEGYGAALRTSAEARERIREFASRKKR